MSSCECDASWPEQCLAMEPGGVQPCYNCRAGRNVLFGSKEAIGVSCWRTKLVQAWERGAEHLRRH